ncbi:MAG: HAD-IA family hydrolase [Burkholderiales bacterium]|nr:HAD-IA family hydrolase [Burkholderiales bacterium]
MKPLLNVAQALRGKRLLILDFDGTVADTTPLHATAFSAVLKPLGVAVDYPSIAGMKTPDAMHHCLARAGRTLAEAEITALVTAKQQRVRQMIVQSLQPLRGVDEFLRWASQRYRLAMVTSGSRGTVNLALEKLGLTGKFDPLICANDVACGKPDPEGFLKVLQLTGLPAAEALVFEDSEAGFLAASAANLPHVDVRGLNWLRALNDMEQSHGY